MSGLLPIYIDSQEIVGYEKTNASADVWIKYEENIEITIPQKSDCKTLYIKAGAFGACLFSHRFCLPQSLMASDQENCILSSINGSF